MVTCQRVFNRAIRMSQVLGEFLLRRSGLCVALCIATTCNRVTLKVRHGRVVNSCFCRFGGKRNPGGFELERTWTPCTGMTNSHFA